MSQNSDPSPELINIRRLCAEEQRLRGVLALYFERMQEDITEMQYGNFLSSYQFTSESYYKIKNERTRLQTALLQSMK